MRSTALADAFEKAGLLPRDAELDIAIAKYLNAGGTIEGAQARLVAATAKVSGTSQLQSVAFGDHRGSASSPDRDRGDLKRVVQSDHLKNVTPVREPSAGQRSAAASVRNVVSITILDTFKVRDGRAIGDVRMGEVERLRAANVMEAAIFELIQQHAVANSDAKIRDVITPKQFQRMQQQASEMADAE